MKMMLIALVPLLFAVPLYLLSQYLIGNYNNQLSCRYKTYGDPARDTIVLVPGLDGVTAFFTDIVPELTMNHHVVVYNLPLCSRGCNESEYTFQFIANDLKDVVDELKLEKVTIVGESFGGIIAQHFALQYSERLDKLVLLSSLAKTILPAEIQWKLDNLMPIISTFGYYYPNFAQFLFAQIHVDDVVEPFESNEVRQLFIKEASFAHFYSVLARIKITSKLDILNEISSIITPTLVIYGEDDHFTKKDSLQLQSRLANANIMSLPGGHLAHLSSPKQFAHLVHSFIVN